MAQIASDDVLEEAFAWLCDRRKHHHYNSDIEQHFARFQSGMPYF